MSLIYVPNLSKMGQSATALLMIIDSFFVVLRGAPVPNTVPVGADYVKMFEDTPTLSATEM